jgi:hypothetical protein
VDIPLISVLAHQYEIPYDRDGRDVLEHVEHNLERGEENVSQNIAKYSKNIYV